jgi:hypothetical protein
MEKAKEEPCVCRADDEDCTCEKPESTKEESKEDSSKKASNKNEKVKIDEKGEDIDVKEGADDKENIDHSTKKPSKKEEAEEEAPTKKASKKEETIEEAIDEKMNPEKDIKEKAAKEDPISVDIEGGGLGGGSRPVALAVKDENDKKKDPIADLVPTLTKDIISDKKRVNTDYDNPKDAIKAAAKKELKKIEELEGKADPKAA